MRTVTKPIVKEEREHPKKQFPFFSSLFAQMLQSKISNGEKMFRGSNINYENPIYIPKHTKFKGWMRERARSSFDKNK